MMDTLHILRVLMAERDRKMPAVAVITAARGRTPHLADLDTMPPPRGAMLPYPPADAAHDAMLTDAARTALVMGGTVALFAAPHQAAAAERWLAALDAEAPR